VSAAESVLVDENPDAGKLSKYFGYFKWKCLKGVYGDHVRQYLKYTRREISGYLTPPTRHTAIWKTSWNAHYMVVFGKKSNNNNFRLTPKTIKTLNRKIPVINQMITSKYQQNYLNIFVYKLNWHHFGNKLSDLLMICGDLSLRAMKQIYSIQKNTLIKVFRCY